MASFCTRAIFFLTLLAFVYCFNTSLISKARKSTNTVKAMIVSAYNFTRKTKKLHHMPTVNDLGPYLLALGKVIRFCKKNQNDVDLNFAFGLFIINVNLKAAMRDNERKIPRNLLTDISDLIKMNTRVLNIFYRMVRTDSNPDDRQNKFISALFWNDTIWVDRLVRFEDQTVQLHRHTFARLEMAYKHWEKYFNAVFDWSVTTMLGPKESDRCVASLVENEVRNFHNLISCSLHQECYPLINNGTNYGYSLTHRLLTLLLARYGRGCSVYSLMTDKNLIERLCNLAYAEAQYIAYHHFGLLLDLVMEQITICTLEGFKEFVRRPFLQAVLKYQQIQGCFGTTENSRVYVRKRDSLRMRATRRKWIMSKKAYAQDLVGGKCNGHLTGVAGAALAAGVRYIVSSSKPHKLDQKRV